MEEVLDIYALPYDPEEPVVCFDEMPRQLLDHVLEPLPMKVGTQMKEGTPRREDYEYEGKGTANLSLNWPDQAKIELSVISSMTRPPHSRPGDAPNMDLLVNR